MKTISFLLFAVTIASCSLNKYEKKIHGSYSIESSEFLYLNDSSKLEGIVLDGQLLEPLAKKWITISGTKFKTISDSIGYFSFKLPAGSYSFNVTAVGFSDFQTKKITLNKNEKLKMKIKLGTHIIYDR